MHWRQRLHAVTWAKSLPSTKQLPLLATITFCRTACRSTHSCPLRITWVLKGAYLRLYGPGEPAFDGSWKPGNFEKAK